MQAYAAGRRLYIELPTPFSIHALCCSTTSRMGHHPFYICMHPYCPQSSRAQISPSCFNGNGEDRRVTACRQGGRLTAFRGCLQVLCMYCDIILTSQQREQHWPWYAAGPLQMSACPQLNYHTIHEGCTDMSAPFATIVGSLACEMLLVPCRELMVRN